MGKNEGELNAFRYGKPCTQMDMFKEEWLYIHKRNGTKDF